MAAFMAKSFKNIYSIFCGKNAVFKPRNVISFQRFYASNTEPGFKQEEFRLEYLCGEHEGKI